MRVTYDQLSSCGDKCTVHAGFMLSYLSLRYRLRSAVLALLSAHPTYGVVVTGHSLGGALATLAAADLQELLNRGNHTPAPQPITLYSYGAPRVGNVAFAQWLTDLLSHGTHYRITHSRDPVVRLPFRFEGYAHTAGEVFYRSLQRSSRVMCADTVTKQDWRCSSGVFSVIVSDHLHYMGETTRCKGDDDDGSDHDDSLPPKTYQQLKVEYTSGRR
ncbi:lipase precursor-like protein [Leptomonas seymouri]|uniref:Lipase-like protein n=1 Tax=Leptomonas seymouri TaxID=5684 RepID=A0A0N1IFY9_LEPSE|nr:lipase precursor-like protein [Leptomonas seymouri]|eukprot:KPI82540.1 lipase precursor-like protein [Leptomonas seymouri]